MLQHAPGLAVTYLSVDGFAELVPLLLAQHFAVVIDNLVELRNLLSKSAIEPLAFPSAEQGIFGLNQVGEPAIHLLDVEIGYHFLSGRGSVVADAFTPFLEAGRCTRSPGFFPNLAKMVPIDEREFPYPTPSDLEMRLENVVVTAELHGGVLPSHVLHVLDEGEVGCRVSGCGVADARGKSLVCYQSKVHLVGVLPQVAPLGSVIDITPEAVRGVEITYDDQGSRAGQVGRFFEDGLELLARVPRVAIDIEDEDAIFALIPLWCVEQYLHHDVFESTARQLEVVGEMSKPFIDQSTNTTATRLARYGSVALKRCGGD